MINEEFIKEKNNTASVINYLIKKKVLTHYGKGVLACVRCGFSDIRALSIDHIYGNGAEHKRSVIKTTIYRWLIKNNYPEGFQTLCMNCQWIKRDENNEFRKGKDLIIKHTPANSLENKYIETEPIIKGMSIEDIKFAELMCKYLGLEK